MFNQKQTLMANLGLHGAFDAPIDSKALELIKHFESLHDGDSQKIGLQPKMDPIGIWTAGYGHALRDPNNPSKFLKGASNRGIAEKMCTLKNESEALALLNSDLVHDTLPIVKEKVSLEALVFLKPHQVGAIVSFVYNCGTSYRNKLGIWVPFAIWDNLTKLFVNPSSYSQDKFMAYWESSVIKAGGKVLPGLVRRRKAEAWLFRYNELKLNF